MPEDTLAMDFKSAPENETTINSARGILETNRPAEVIKEWKEQHNTIIRSRNKEKAREMMEKKWHGFFIQPHKQQRDLDTSSVISYRSNATKTSTNQRQQLNNYESNISKLPIMRRPPVTRYGADIPKEVLDNIPPFDGKQGELSEFLNTIKSYMTMYRVHKT